MPEDNADGDEKDKNKNKSGSGSGDADLLGNVAAILREHRGSHEKALEAQVDKNYRLRQQLKDARAKQTPDGAVVLTGDDAARWTALKDLGKPEEIRAGLAERDALKGEKDLRRYARAIGADEDVFIDLAQAKKLQLVEREAEVELEDGKTEKRQLPHVVTGSGEGKRYEPVITVIERDFPKYKPALFPTEGDSGTARETRQESKRPTGVRYVEQGEGQRRTPAKPKESEAIKNALNAKYPLPKAAAS